MSKARKHLAVWAALILSICMMAVAVADDEVTLPAETAEEQIVSEALTFEEAEPSAEPQQEETLSEESETASTDADETPDAPQDAEPDAQEPVESEPAEPAPEQSEPVIPEVTDAPTDVPETPVDTEAPETSESEAPAFSARVQIKLVNEGTLYYGDRVTLRAVVEDANAEYAVRWEYLDEEASAEEEKDVWVAIGEGEEYAFTVNAANVGLTYRAVVNDQLIREYKLPEVQERQVEAEPGEETDQPEADEETDQGLEPEEPAEDDVLDEEPAEEEPVEEESDEEAPAPELNPNRSVDIHAEWEGELHFGDSSTLVATLIGYDNAVYTLQWQTSKDDVDWVDVEGATELRYDMVVTEENYLDYWRVVVTITDVAE